MQVMSYKQIFYIIISERLWLKISRDKDFDEVSILFLQVKLLLFCFEEVQVFNLSVFTLKFKRATVLDI